MTISIKYHGQTDKMNCISMFSGHLKERKKKLQREEYKKEDRRMIQAWILYEQIYISFVSWPMERRTK